WEKQTGSLFPGVNADLDPVSRNELINLSQVSKRLSA
ncbi:unnamed protein product, partial [marine sediment metagenome]